MRGFHIDVRGGGCNQQIQIDPNDPERGENQFILQPFIFIMLKLDWYTDIAKMTVQYFLVMRYQLINEEIVTTVFIIQELINFSYLVYPTYNYQVYKDLVYSMLAAVARPYLIIDFQIDILIALFVAFFLLLLIPTLEAALYTFSFQNDRSANIQNRKTYMKFLEDQIVLFALLHKVVVVLIIAVDNILMGFMFDFGFMAFFDQDPLLQIVMALFLFTYLWIVAFKIKNINQQFLLLITPNNLLSTVIQLFQSFIFAFGPGLVQLQISITIAKAFVEVLWTYLSVPFLQEKYFTIKYFSQSVTILFGFVLLAFINNIVDIQSARDIFLLLAPVIVALTIQAGHRRRLYLLMALQSKQSTLDYRKAFFNLLSLDDAKNQVLKAYLYQSSEKGATVYGLVLSYFQSNNLTVTQSNLVELQLLNISMLIMDKCYIQAYIFSQMISKCTPMVLRNTVFKEYSVQMHQLARVELTGEISKLLLRQMLVKKDQISYQYLQDFHEAQLVQTLVKLKVLTSFQQKQCFLKQQKGENQPQGRFESFQKFAHSIVDDLRDLEWLLKRQITLKLYSALSFFYAEILNDYLAAQSFTHHESIFQEEAAEQSKYTMRFSRENSAYILNSLEDTNYNMKIISTSCNFASFFQCSKCEKISDLIPSGIREFHHYFISQLLLHARSKRYRTLSRVFAQQQQFIQLLDSFLDTYFSMQELTFVNIFVENHDGRGYILLNKNLQITGINKHLLHMLGFSASQIKSFKPKAYLYGQPVNSLIPNVAEHILGNEFQLRQPTWVINFFKPNKTIKTNSQSLQRMLSMPQFVSSFECQLQLETRYVEGHPAYFIFIVESVYTRTQTFSTVQTFSGRNFQEESDSQTSQMDEKVKIYKPYDYQQDMEPFKSPTESHVELHLRLENSDMGNIKEKFRFQQRYFSRRMAQDYSEQSNNQQKKTREREGTFGRPNGAEMSDSQGSIIREIKKSIYFDKYQMINKISKKTVRSVYSKLSSTFSVLSCILGMISLIIQSSILAQDFSLYLSDLDTLTINVEILEPYINQIMLIFESQAALASFNLTQYQAVIQSLESQYFEFQQNTLRILQNPTIISNFDDSFLLNLTAQLSGYREDQSVQSVINSLVNTNFEFLQVFKTGVGNLNLDFQQSAQSIWYMVELCSYLGNILIEETLKRNSVQMDTQIRLISGFLSVNFIFLVLSYYFSRKNYHIKSLFTDMFCNIDRRLYQIEYEDLKKLEREELIEDIQSYSFDLQFKEHSLRRLEFQTKCIIESSKFHRKAQRSKVSLYSIVLALQFIAFFVVNLMDSLVLNHFVGRYKPTSIMYKNSSDLSVSVSKLFAFKDLLRSQEFQMMREAEKLYFQDAIHSSILQIEDMTSEFLMFDSERYIYSSEFKQQFVHFQKNDLCWFFEESPRYEQELCRNTFDGTFQQGIQSVLAHILSSHYGMNNTQELKQDKVGAYILSLVVKNITKLAQQDILQQTVYFDQLLQIILITSIICSLVGVLTIILTQVLMFNKELQIATLFIHLLPKSVLFLDNSFERRVTSLILKNQNI